jgi:cell division septum initiation protein DivIVA
MKKIITTALLTGSLMSMFGVTTLFADQTQTIDQKAKVIVHDAKVKADKLIEDAKEKARTIIEKAKEEASDLKETTLAIIGVYQ